MPNLNNAARHLWQKGNAMTAELNTEIQLESTATTRHVKVKISDLTFDVDRFCHRDSEALSEDNVKALRASIESEGLLDPIEIVRTADGKALIIDGNRRGTCLKQLAEKNRPGFKPDTEIEVIEVLNASAADLL